MEAINNPAPTAEWIEADLKRSGITLDQARRAGISGGNFPPKQIKDLLGYAKFDNHAIAVMESYLIPYQHTAGEKAGYQFGRLKLRGTLGGAKYLSPSKKHVKSPTHLYITDGEFAKIQSPKRPLLIVEGEKKALAVASTLESAGLDNDYCTIGIAGVRQWQNAPEWGKLKIRLSGRDLYLIFDADCADNADVRQEQLKLWAWGLERGCRVFLVTWPAHRGKGIDDYLVAGGSLPDLLTGAMTRNFLECFKDRPIAEIVDALARVKMGPVTAQTLALKIREYWGDYSKNLLIKELLNKNKPAAPEGDADKKQIPAMNWPERAQEFLQMIKDKTGRVLIRRWNGAYFHYRQGRYVQVEDEFVTSIVQRFLAGSYPEFSTSQGAGNLISNSRPEVYVDSSKFKFLPCWVATPKAKNNVKLADRPDPEMVIPMRNGLLKIAPDGQSWELMPHTPDYFSTNCLPFDYDPEATCPLHDEFIKTTVDEDYLDLIQEWGGLCMTPITRFQRFVMVHGPAGTGKGVWANILCAVIGWDNISSLPIEALTQSKQHIEGIVGKLLNLTGEIRVRADIDEGTLKSITGDNTISINPKYKPPYDYKPKCKLMFLMNKVPTFADRTNAVWRRVILIPFRKHPEKIDLLLEDKIKKEEMSGIFNWYLKGLSRLLKNDQFSIPDSMTLELSRRKRSSDPVLMFLCDYADTRPGGLPLKLHGGDFYKAYSEWCLANGHQARYIFAASGFLEELNRICDDNGVYRKSARLFGKIEKCIIFTEKAYEKLQIRLDEFRRDEAGDSDSENGLDLDADLAVDAPDFSRLDAPKTRPPAPPEPI